MSNAFEKYREIVTGQINTAFSRQADKLEQAAQKFASAVEKGNTIYTFGCNHAGLLAQELYYRSGGLVQVDYIRAPGLALDVKPPVFTTEMERLDGYGGIIMEVQKFNDGDILFIHSVSGRNEVVVDAAKYAKEKGIFTICLTNLNTASKVESRHYTGHMLHELCDIVLDNFGVFGDASFYIQEADLRCAPTSTAVGAAIMNGVVARCVEILFEKGIKAPVFASSNIPGGQEHNSRILK